MDIQNIYMVVRLAEFGNFSLAAEACFVSQSSFSRNIRNIEESLGTELFIRKKNGVVLTPEGKIFLKHARELLKQYEEMRAKLNSAGKREKTYHIGLLNVSNIQSILPIISDYILRNKNQNISLQEMDWQTLQNKMHEGYFDAVISWVETLPENMNQYLLAEDYVVLIAAKNHPIAQRMQDQKITLADICDETFILSTPSPPTKVIDKIFAKEGFKPKLFHAASHPCSMLHLVEKGLGIGIIANSTYERFQSENIQKMHLKMGYHFTYAACFMDEEDRRSQKLAAFLLEQKAALWE